MKENQMGTRKLVRLPWGDYVDAGQVALVSIDRSGTGFIVSVSLRCGLESVSKAHGAEGDAKRELKAIVESLTGAPTTCTCGYRPPLDPNATTVGPHHRVGCPMFKP